MSERPTELPTLTYGGRVFRLPFASLFRELTAAEDTALRESARAGGIGYPALVYDSEAWGPDCLIDGANRLRIAGEERLDICIQKLHLTDAEARRKAEDLNIVRRQVTQAEAREARARRIGQVAEMRQAGQSLRAIAAEVGVSVPQVRRDLEEAGVPPAQVATVTGTDGKVYRLPAGVPGAQVADTPETGVPPGTGDEPDRGDAWEPNDEDGDADGEDVVDPDGEVDESLPVPSLDASRPPLPKRKGKAPKPLSKDHPFYEIATRFTSLSAAITKAIAGEHGEKLKAYLTQVQISKTPNPPLIEHRAIWIAGKSYGARFVGLRALRKLIVKAGNPGKAMSPAKVVELFKSNAEDCK